MVIDGPNGFEVSSKSAGVDTAVKTAGVSESSGMRCGILSGGAVGVCDGRGVGVRCSGRVVGDGVGSGAGRVFEGGVGDCDGEPSVSGMIAIGERGGSSVVEGLGMLRSATFRSCWAYGGRMGDE